MDFSAPQRDDDGHDGDGDRPFKHQRILRVFDYEDDNHFTFFEDTEIQELERYDYGSDDEGGADDFRSIFSASEEDGALKCWIVPYTTLEPSLNPEELVKLDLLADAVEIEKLKDMKVLNKPRNQRVLALKLAKVSRGRLRSTALLMV